MPFRPGALTDVQSARDLIGHLAVSDQQTAGKVDLSRAHQSVNWHQLQLILTIIHNADLQALLDSIDDPLQKARIHSAGGPVAGLWIFAGKHQTTACYRNGMLVRLGLEKEALARSPTAPPASCARCHKPWDALHVHTCVELAGYRTGRHNDVRDALVTAARRGTGTTDSGQQVKMWKEPNMVVTLEFKRRNDADNTAYRADLAIRVINKDNSVSDERVVDVVGTFVGASSHGPNVANVPGLAADGAAKEKVGKYTARLKDIGEPAFVPFAFEVGGRVCAQVPPFLSWLAARQQLVAAKRHTMTSRQACHGVLRQRLAEEVSIAIAHGDARILMAARDLARAHGG
jgi:hypothetical protein